MEENKNLISEELPEDKPEIEEAEVAAENVAEEKQEDLHGENLGDRVRMLSPTMLVIKRFFRSKLSVIGLVTLVILFAISFIGPVFSKWADGNNPVVDNSKENIQTIVKVDQIIYINAEGEEVSAYIVMEHTPTTNVRGDMSWTHWLGTNDLGEDLFTNLMLGGRISLTIGFVVVILEAIIGVILGGLAGYFGGWVDNLIMRIVDILSCIPTIPIMLILSSMLDSWKVEGMIRLYYLMGILTLLGWTGIARLVRGQILSLREQEFMLAAKASGLSVPRKIFKHLLPNVMPQLIVSMTMGLGSIILTEATLGFLGIGVPLGTPTWGTMINSATKMDILIGYPNFWVPPGICITLAILAFNFVGDGLRDAFDPKMKR